MKKITNSHFRNFKEAVNNCCGKASEDDTFLSDMLEASYSDSAKVSFYSDEFLDPFINMETIKLDEISKYRKQMLGLPEKSWFNEFPAVDAICIDRNNEWFFIEFKNAKVDNEIKSIKQKMLNSLWFCFYMLSKSDKDDDVLNSDAIKFSREHITYIVVIKRDKNIDDAKEIEEKEGINEHYTHRKLIEVINYYFKDVYMLTEYEFRDFILKFKS
ncbi:MAG: hypothetical protein J5926_02930 [Ruminococcus sp.]|nr:hypothetical protein [Ruminococcus sp.]